MADQDAKELLYERCLAAAGLSQDITLLNEVVGRRREKLTLDAFEDLMTHLGGLREERKAVLLVTEGWLLPQPNPKLASRLGGRRRRRCSIRP